MYISGKCVHTINNYTIDTIKKYINNCDYLQCSKFHESNLQDLIKWKLKDYFMIHCLSFVNLDTKLPKPGIYTYDFHTLVLEYYTNLFVNILNML